MIFNQYLWMFKASITQDLDSGLPYRSFMHNFRINIEDFWLLFLLLLIFALFICALLLQEKVKESTTYYLHKKEKKKYDKNILNNLSKSHLGRLIKLVNNKSSNKTIIPILFLTTFIPQSLFGQSLFAQQKIIEITRSSMWQKAGVIITLVLLAIPLLFILIFLIFQVSKRLKSLNIQVKKEEARNISDIILSADITEVSADILAKQAAEEYQLEPNLLSGGRKAKDDKGLISIDTKHEVAIVSRKKKSTYRPNIDPALSKLVIWYLLTATAWLLFGTTVGEYLGLKFIAPEMENLSWLSFGRLRPVHTNAVFWGWASLGMIGLAYYVIPRVSNTKLHSLRWGWYSLFLINITVILGSISLMAGINNGGGEYREYIWPVMLPFALALIITLINFYKTIAKRTTREIYISNWYIVSAIIFTIVITLVAYLPFWQDGLGETIVQGYYMHQGVGMWFMLFTLGLVYYYLPQQLNRPIYSYSLGILAFWSQILFYTVIGSHHFVFSAIPWWLQTVAIVGSAGMAIPVFAGTTNFLMTFKGAWHKIGNSYTLPFFLVGIIFYFTGSLQGTAEAFRETNLIWHFTDFTVAHSHLTMYGIICFFLWACIYAIMPRFTGKEAPQITVGAHFWLALLGLMFYTIPLMYGGTIRGIMWLEGKPFIDSVTYMAPIWLWRAIGGSFMWISHLFFAYNMYKMISVPKDIDLGEEIMNQIESTHNSIKHK